MAGAALWTCPAAYFLAGAALQPCRVACMSRNPNVRAVRKVVTRVQIPWQACQFVRCAEILRKNLVSIDGGMLVLTFSWEGPHSTLSGIRSICGGQLQNLDCSTLVELSNLEDVPHGNARFQAPICVILTLLLYKAPHFTTGGQLHNLYIPTLFEVTHSGRSTLYALHSTLSGSTLYNVH